MSLGTWKAEFYPVDANEAEKYTGDEQRKFAIEHSLTKWRGLTPEALRRHDCAMSMFCGITMIINQEDLKGTKRAPVENIEIGLTTCALCKAYFDGDVLNKSECVKCPLYQAGCGCSDHVNNPWDTWFNKMIDGMTVENNYDASSASDPSVMIGILTELMKDEK